MLIIIMARKRMQPKYSLSGKWDKDSVIQIQEILNNQKQQEIVLFIKT